VVVVSRQHGAVEGFDDTISALEGIIARCSAEGDRAGYFPAMYVAVTGTVQDRCASGHFEDPARMERFVARFATRYLDAEAAWRRDGAITRSWRAAFETAANWRPIILQHLLLGINAHINLDLGVAAAEIGGTGPLDAVQADFDAVNDVLGELVEGSQGALDQVSPWLDLVDRVGGAHDEALINFSLRRARAQAWSVAVRLAPLTGDARAGAIRSVDASTARLAGAIAHPGVGASALLLMVRSRERAEPARVMELLAAVRT
jgi:hypothetical protein